MEKIVVDLDNVRLDAYIAQKCENLSRTMIQKLIEDGEILVNGQEKKISYKTKQGDVIEIHIPEAKEINLKAQDIPESEGHLQSYSYAEARTFIQLSSYHS